MTDFTLFSGLAASSQLRAVTTPRSQPLRPDLPNTLMKAKSASQLPKMAMAGTPSRGRNLFEGGDSTYLNTLPDPRTPSPARRTPSADSRHPDLSNEVAMLSTKLVNAINHQTNLDDTLQHTRHELEAASRRVADYEAQVKEHARLISTKVLVKKSEADASIKAMHEELVEAQKQRDTAEKGRKEMEVELESLTSALFEEANSMVAAARKDGEATERKNAQLRSQLQDTELLLASQQEQLADLKAVMERITNEQDEIDTIPHSSTAPSTPGHDAAAKMSGMFDHFPMSPNAPSFGETPPDQPLRFSHLITPVLRSDVQAYADFAELLKSSRAAAPSHSRASSGLAFSNSNASNSSTISSSPNIPGSFSSASTSSPRESSYTSSLPPLKDNKFYKRCLAEDIEPALRLDLAPGLSWLARRTVIGAVTSGTLVVEPFIPHSRFYNTVYACSLCGETRRNEVHARRHRFRTSEDDGAQRYPLCEYCLGRIRATCDFLGFLRMVRDGLWRAGTEEDINGAWEESVRLREKMFWARLGGGVVPTVSARTESPTALQQRRTQGGLLRRTSSNSTNATRISSRDDGPRSSFDSHGQTLDVPKLKDPIKSKLRKENVPASNSSSASDLHDFATSIVNPIEAPSTPVKETESKVNGGLDRPSTPPSQTSIAGPTEATDSKKQDTESNIIQVESKATEYENRETSTVPVDKTNTDKQDDEISTVHVDEKNGGDQGVESSAIELDKTSKDQAAKNNALGIEDVSGDQAMESSVVEVEKAGEDVELPTSTIPGSFD